MLMFFRVHRHHSVLIEQHRIALKHDHHREFVLVLCREPCAPVSECVSPFFIGDPLGLFHPLSHFEVPLLPLWIYTRLFPDGKFFCVCT
jgi:hypothetical protein